MLAKFSYQRTTSIKEATAAASRPETRILAGGTDLLGCLRDGVFQASRLVSLNGIKELKGIRPRAGGGLRIGALTNNAGDRCVLAAAVVAASEVL